MRFQQERTIHLPAPSLVIFFSDGASDQERIVVTRWLHPVRCALAGGLPRAALPSSE